jgi:hypothetical protein
LVKRKGMDTRRCSPNLKTYRHILEKMIGIPSQAEGTSEILAAVHKIKKNQKGFIKKKKIIEILYH